MLKSVKSVKSSFLKKRTFDFMGKAIGIDFGLKRTGFAISDDSGIIASPMETIDSRNIPDYLDQIITKEKIHLVVIGFPANNFRGQEPGSNEDIKQFCRLEYGVEFPMAAKVSVRGDDQAPLFTYLTSLENQDFDGDIK